MLHAQLNETPVDSCSQALDRLNPTGRAFPNVGELHTILHSGATLTLAALAEDADTWVDDYTVKFHARPEFGEIAGFLRYVGSYIDDADLASIAQFERAVLMAHAAHGEKISVLRPNRGSKTLVHLHPAACIVDLPAPAEQVIASVALGLGIPRFGRWPVLVAPTLPTLWRDATPAEDLLCTWLTRPRRREDLDTRFPKAKPLLDELKAAGVVVG